MLMRKQVGKTTEYKDHKIVVRYLGPDLLCYVDNIELSAFYENVKDANAAGVRYIDLIECEKEASN